MLLLWTGLGLGAIIFSVIVLLFLLFTMIGNGARGFTQTERSASDAVAVVNDPDPQGMNVRSGPGSTFKIIGNLPKQDVEGIGVQCCSDRGRSALC